VFGATPISIGIWFALRAAVETALSCVGARRAVVSAAIYEKSMAPTLLDLAIIESRIRGSFCCTAADFEAVIKLMARRTYVASSWVTSIGLDGGVDEASKHFRPTPRGRSASIPRSE
jgi:threonine dehydrogenase-like Zn-dependent dehydrogenase